MFKKLVFISESLLLREGPGFSRESELFCEEVLAGFSLLMFARVDIQNEFQESVIIEVHEFIWLIDLIHHLNS